MQQSKTISLLAVLALGGLLMGADAPIQPPEIAAEHEAAVAAGDAYAVKAAATIDQLKAQVASLQAELAAALAQLAQADADKKAAVQKALEDYKASLAAVPYPPTTLSPQ